MASLRLGRIDESFYQVVGGVVAEVLRRYGHDIVASDGSHTEVYDALGAGTIDLAVAFWLPYGHADAWKRLGSTVKELATLYKGAQFFWAMPGYVDKRIRSIADLASPELSRDVPRVIRGLSLDATITTASQTAISEYGLEPLGACRSMHVDRFGTECFVESRRDEGATPQRCDRRATKYSAEQAASSGRRAYSDRLLGFYLEPGDFAMWEISLENAVTARQSVILPLWTPYYLNVVHELRALGDPKGVLGAGNRVVLGARSDVVGHIDDRAVAALQSTGLTLAIVSELDRRVHVDRRSPDDVAADWVARQTAPLN